MFYSVSKAAKLLSVSRQTIYYWIKNSEIEYTLKNNRYKINSDDVQKLIEEKGYGAEIDS